MVLNPLFLKSLLQILWGGAEANQLEKELQSRAAVNEDVEFLRRVNTELRTQVR